MPAIAMPTPRRRINLRYGGYGGGDEGTLSALGGRLVGSLVGLVGGVALGDEGSGLWKSGN